MVPANPEERPVVVRRIASAAAALYLVLIGAWWNVVFAVFLAVIAFVVAWRFPHVWRKIFASGLPRERIRFEAAELAFALAMIGGAATSLVLAVVE